MYCDKIIVRGGGVFDYRKIFGEIVENWPRSYPVNSQIDCSIYFQIVTRQLYQEIY